MFAAAAGLGTVSLLGLVAGVEQGLFNGLLQRVATLKAGRSVRFAALRAHLLSTDPWFSIDGLVVGSPPNMTHDDLAYIPHLTGRLDLLTLLAGRLQMRELTLLRPDLHLVRSGPGRNNFSFGAGGAPGGLRYARRLTIVDGKVHYIDSERQLTMDGAFSHDGRPALAMPFRLDAVGVAKGEPFVLHGIGGPLNGRAPGTPYSLSAELQDGLARTRLVGVSVAPFVFAGFDLRFAASGPNLADYAYLVGASTPNSPPFSLTGRARRQGQATVFTDISGRVGRSDVHGTISSVRRPSGSRSIRATIVSQTFFLADARALLLARPTHASTRARSGAVGPAERPTDRVFPDQPFKLGALRSKDITVDLKAARVADAPFMVSDLSTRLAVRNGRIALAPLSFGTAPGRVRASVSFDGGHARPIAAVVMSLTGGRLSALRRDPDARVDGDADLWMNVVGEGASPHAMAADMRGRVAFRLRRGHFQRYKAAALAGDLVEAVGLALGDKKSRQIPLDCAVGEFIGQAGHFQLSRLEIVTPAGSTIGEGSVDLGGESLSMVLRGTPTQRRLLRLDAPITVEGPLRHPAIKVQAAAAVRRQGPAGLLAVVTAPLAAVLPHEDATAENPSCDPLLVQAARFVKLR
jgi:uncharacterized protein involved in outer membrane biogenesis